MKRELKVVWNSGAFLTPQLFEGQERYFEGEMQFRSLLGGFARWGISEIQLDRSALTNGKFRLTGCAGIFKDGFAFSMPDADSLPDGRDFSFDESNLEVFLAIQERREGTRNISNPGGPTLRYISQDKTISSDAEGLEETIQVARPCFKIIFSTESTDGLDVLPIARVVRGGSGYTLDPKYIPPCLNAAVNSYFWDTLVKRLLDRIIFVSTQLTGQRSSRSELLADFADSDIRRFWVLHIVNRALPELRHLYSIRNCHPEQLYRFVLGLGGALFTFWGPKEAEVTPGATVSHFGITGFPVYDHLGLGNCLLPVAIQVEEMLRTMVYRKRRCEPLNLAIVKSGEHFKAAVTAEDLAQGTFYLAVKVSATAGAIEIDENVKILGPVTVRDARRLVGLQLGIQETRAPADCPQQDGHLYYRVIQPSIRSIRPVSTGAARAGLQDREQIVANRRFEVWQDIQDSVDRNNGEIHVFVLNPSNIANVHLLMVGPESVGYAPLRDETT